MGLWLRMVYLFEGYVYRVVEFRLSLEYGIHSQLIFQFGLTR